ncbi:MAG: hypothetical protein LBS11_05390 [Oscillospiraceae bacterium]|jgi:tetratricopeptide (TPR) repeat protein|nr:hypothetical protein [Oscillospiraceae bacterium]
MSELKQDWGQVLPFARSAKTLHARALSQRKGRQWMEAAELLRRASEQEPGNEQVLVDLAQTYAQIGCNALANRVLLRVLHDNPERKDLLYDMGVNFFSMQSWPQAHDCLSLYIRGCPTGKSRREANDLILYLYMQQNSRVERRIQRATSAYADGKRSLASRLMKRTFALSPLNGDAHAVAAFLRLSDGDAKAALTLARQAYKLDHHNTRALCAMVVSLSQLGSRSAAMKFLQRAVAESESEAERVMVVHTACEIEAYSNALAMLQTLTSEQPLEPTLTHLLAVCYCHAGREKDALPLWARLRRIDPDDTVADYCFEALREAIANQTEFRPSHIRAVPMDETLRRLGRIRELADGDVDTLQDVWSGREEIRRLVSWGLNQPEPRIRAVMLGLLRVAGDDYARAMLRDALISVEQPDAVKQLYLEALYEMGDPGPHYVTNAQGFSIAFVQAAQTAPLSNPHGRALKKLAARLRREFGDVSATLEAVWQRLLREEGEIADTDSWVAALEWEFRERMGQHESPAERRVMRRVRRLKPLWDQMERESLGEAASASDAGSAAPADSVRPLDAWPALEGFLDGQEVGSTMPEPPDDPPKTSAKAPAKRKNAAKAPARTPKGGKPAKDGDGNGTPPPDLPPMATMPTIPAEAAPAPRKRKPRAAPAAPTGPTEK